MGSSIKQTDKLTLIIIERLHFNKDYNHFLKSEKNHLYKLVISCNIKKQQTYMYRLKY